LYEYSNALYLYGRKGCYFLKGKKIKEEEEKEMRKGERGLAYYNLNIIDEFIDRY